MHPGSTALIVVKGPSQKPRGRPSPLSCPTGAPLPFPGARCPASLLIRPPMKNLYRQGEPIDLLLHLPFTIPGHGYTSRIGALGFRCLFVCRKQNRHRCREGQGLFYLPVFRHAGILPHPLSLPLVLDEHQTVLAQRRPQPGVITPAPDPYPSLVPPLRLLCEGKAHQIRPHLQG